MQDWTDQVGGRVESPLTLLLREHLDALRALLVGAAVTTQAGTSGWTRWR